MLSRLTVDLDALAHNYGVLKAAAGGAEVAPVIKADGYGLGAGPIARRLYAEGARSFFIARLEEGEALRRDLGSREAAILVLDGVTPDTIARLQAARLTPVLITAEQAALWTGKDRILHVDTGMNRSGVSPAEAQTLARSGFRPEVVMSHLGSAGEPDNPRNAAQLAVFTDVRALFPTAKASLAATAGIFLSPDYRFDQVRPGIGLFGGGPREVPDDRFKAVATLTAPVLEIRALKAGDQAGYGSTFTAPRDMRIAILPCGYADGVLRTAHKRGSAWLNGTPAHLVFYTMDLSAV
jgi:alanine racemase